MSPHHSSRIGTCPRCRAEITESDVLIEYETGDDQQSVWVECPDCGEVVKPV
jgi:uncharacterized Zn finger protein